MTSSRTRGRMHPAFPPSTPIPPPSTEIQHDAARLVALAKAIQRRVGPKDRVLGRMGLAYEIADARDLLTKLETWGKA